MIDRNWTTPAKNSFRNAQQELIYAIRALENTGGDFKNTIQQIKENIGDLQICISNIEEYEEG